VLALTQREDLQQMVREDGSDGVDPLRSTLARVVVETQRLLPSSAMVTRMTARPVQLGASALPASCEVVVSSLLAHRDPRRFPRPLRFDPERWRDLPVSPFEFFPFGAGVRACLGATLARTILTRTVRRLVERGTLRLLFDTQVGWRLPDVLAPSPGIAVVVDEHRRRRSGRATGPIIALVDFDAA
jgi:cytochrome P450